MMRVKQTGRIALPLFEPGSAAKRLVLSVVGLGSFFCMAAGAIAVELTGHVTAAANNTAQIIVDGNSVPSPGDAATIYFKLPGTDDEVLVGSGKVTEVAADSVTVKIEDAKGSAQKDQFVRIVSENPKPKSSVAIATPIPGTPERPLIPSSTPRPPDYPQPVSASKPTKIDGATEPHFLAGAAALTRGDDKTCLKETTIAIRVAPDYWGSYRNRGVVYAHLGQWKQALVDYQKCAQLNPADVEAKYAIGVCYSNLAQPKRAIEAYTECLRLDPKHASALCNRGAAYVSLKDGKHALPDLELAVELAPNVASAWNNLGMARWILGQRQRALDAYDEALRLDPNLAQAKNNRAGAAAELGKAAPVTAAAIPKVESGDENPSKLVGKWQGGRHVTRYMADGTYILDPDITPQPIRTSVARWRVEGQRLVTTDAAGTHNYTIVSLTKRELVTKDEQGRTYREKRISP
jgi:Tfp pilus assembly protein PilF